MQIDIRTRIHIEIHPDPKLKWAHIGIHPRPKPGWDQIEIHSNLLVGMDSNLNLATAQVEMHPQEPTEKFSFPKAFKMVTR